MEDVNLFKKGNSIYLKEISSKNQLSEDDDCDGYLLRTSESEARRIIDSLNKKKKIIAVYGNDNQFNRRSVESMKINYLVSPEAGLRKDTLKQRDSGLNHVVAKEAKRKKIEILINLNELKVLDKKERSIRISRIIQNIKVCRKAKCGIKIASFAKNKEDLFEKKQRESIGQSFGMSSLQVKNCCMFDLKKD